MRKGKETETLQNNKNNKNNKNNNHSNLNGNSQVQQRKEKIKEKEKKQQEQPQKQQEQPQKQQQNGHKHIHHQDYTQIDYKKLQNFEELEHWRQDNPGIRTGYRTLNHSYISCLRTLFFLHNETGNVLSHLVGGILFIGLTIHTYYYVIPTGWADRLIFASFLFGAIGCLWLSAFFHLFCAHSKSVCDAWNKCDYIGIMVLIIGSCYPMVYYGFHCDVILQMVYLVSMSAFGAATVPLLVMETFNTPKFRVVRTLLFVLLGFTGVIPAFHAMYLYGFQLVFKAGALDWTLAMGFSYLFGAYLYAMQFPESKFPGKFDYWFHSHQIFHFCVVAGAFLHYVGLIKSYNWHMANECYGLMGSLTPPVTLHHHLHHYNVTQ